MNPLMQFLLSLGATGAGTGLSWLGSKNQTYTDQTQNWLDQFNQQNGYQDGNRDLNAGRSGTFWDMLTRGNLNPQGYMNMFNQQGQQGSDLLGQATRSANRSASDIWAEFAKTQPGMIDYANNATNAAMTQNGSSMEDLAKLQSSNAINSIENMLSRNGGHTSGAAMAALSRGASEPLLAAQTQLGQMRSNLFSSLFNPMAGAGYGQEMNRTNDLLNALSGSNNLMGNYGNMGSSLAGLFGGASEQNFLNPTMMADPNFLTLLGNGLMGAGFKGFGNAIA